MANDSLSTTPLSHNLKILHLTTANETRGIADYTRDMIAALTTYGIEAEIYPLDRQDFGHLSSQEIDENLSVCCTKAQSVDLIHIQHEFLFFSRRNLKHSIDIFHQFLQKFSQINKPVVVTFHTEAHFFSAHIRAFLSYKNLLRNLQNYRLKQYWNKKISLLFNKNHNFHAIVHTKQTQLKLANSGISADKITIMPIGISPRKNLNATDNTTAKQVLNYPKDVILLSIFGFITENKGHEFAIKALELLPEHYHLAIIGGPHPEAKNSNLERILELSHFNSTLKERIRITGYADSKTADLYHAATDICLAPYHGNMSGSAAIGWALSSGKPIIASKTATFNEINKEIECLLMCPEKSVFELAWQIENLMADNNLQTKLVENALKYTANNQWTQVVKKIIMCYEKCVLKHLT